MNLSVTSKLFSVVLIASAALSSASIFAADEKSATKETATKESAKKETIKKESTQGAAAIDADGYNSKTDPIVELKTNMGDIVIELNPSKAKNTVKNFLKYVSNKHYENTIFHRVISNFMIQGGGFDKDMHEKSALPPIHNENSSKSLSNKKYTIAMARTNDPHSASAQIFINVKDNENLDFKSEDTSGWGYCAFGKVISGMDVVDKIRDVKTGEKNGFSDVPVEPVIIESAKLVKATK